MIKKLLYLIILVNILLFSAFSFCKEKRTDVNDKEQRSSLNYQNRDLVPSGRWQWRQRWHLGASTRWNIYKEDSNRIGNWVLPQADSEDYSLSYVRYRGYYGSRIPYAGRDHTYRYRNFRPSHYFSRYRHYNRYYPFGYFYYHYYPRSFISFWAYPFWSWYWYPSWWISFDYWYPPSYYYYNYWYPRRYYYPADPNYNKYFARLRTNVEPDEALIYIDGHFIGRSEEHDGWWKTFPIKAGKHQAIIKLPGYKTEIIDFEVAPSQYYELKIRMLPSTKEEMTEENNTILQEDISSQKGYLNLQIEPSNSSIYIDNKYIGNYDEIKKANNKISLPAGKHTIEILSPSYLPYSSEFTINENEDTSLTISLIKKELI